METFKIAMYVVLALLAIGVLVNIKDIVRYVRISSM